MRHDAYRALRLHQPGLRPDLHAGGDDAGGGLRALRRPAAPLRARLAVAAAAGGDGGPLAHHGEPLRQVLPARDLSRGRGLDLRGRQHADAGGPHAPHRGVPRLRRRHRALPAQAALRHLRGVRLRPEGGEDPARRTPSGARRSSPSTAPRGCRTTISSPRTPSSSAGTATRRSRRRWISGGSRWRPTPGATS